MHGIGTLMEKPENPLALPLSEDSERRQVSVNKSRFSPDSRPASTLVLDFRPPEL